MNCPKRDASRINIAAAAAWCVNDFPDTGIVLTFAGWRNKIRLHKTIYISRPAQSLQSRPECLRELRFLRNMCSVAFFSSFFFLLHAIDLSLPAVICIMRLHETKVNKDENSSGPWVRFEEIQESKKVSERKCNCQSLQTAVFRQIELSRSINPSRSN